MTADFVKCPYCREGFVLLHHHEIPKYIRREGLRSSGIGLIFPYLKLIIPKDDTFIVERWCKVCKKIVRVRMYYYYSICIE